MNYLCNFGVMRLHGTKLKSLISAVFVGILLFNYVSSTMFWHCHVIDGQIITHSHIYWDGHAGGIDVLEYVFTESIVLACDSNHASDFDLRGPPALI